ncbi:hypothetical protein DYQ86_18670 [Acidobacteria bacterium AB60]|nr:hypothetical protein DYQ86_18670 [Acidobacteria bacterium AB60]
MQMNTLKAIVKTAARGAAVLLLGAGIARAQQVINLSAGASTLALPDGSSVPMWGYACGTPDPNSTANCAAANPGATGWSPVVITVPTGADLQINLTNNLTFTGGSIPTSLTIVGQLGGGLGTDRSTVASPDHSLAQSSTTWPIAGAPGTTPPSQGPRVQSFATEVAVGTTGQLLWKGLNPGTYLIESGTHPSIQGPMGLYGILVVTSAPSGATPGCAYPDPANTATCKTPYNADVPLVFSEVDPVQNQAVSTAVNTAGFSETKVWSGLPGGCGNPASPLGVVNTCYPPAVNYKPLYYLINGVGFNKTSAASSLFPANPASASTGTVLVRMVNAGLRMHVPSIVGAQTDTNADSGFTLVAEDGNLLPGLPRVQSEVFLAAGKTYDVMINAQANVATTAAAYANALPIYDRELSLSGNAINRDAGMLAYIGIAGSTVPAASGNKPAQANPDTYNALVAGQTLTISDPALGLIANDINVYGVALLAGSGPSSGTVTLNTNGTFTYVPNQGSTATSDSFTYVVNGAKDCTVASNCATVTLAASAITSDSITCTPGTFNASTSSYLAINTPGVLANCKDNANLPLTVDTTTAFQVTGSGTVTGQKNGGFIASATTSGPVSFTFVVKNTLGKTAQGTATINFPAGSGLQVKVLDPNDASQTPIGDYRWVIEEDRTFYVDPACAATQGMPQAQRPSQCAANPINFGTNFHTSYMPLVAQGCTGPLSCGSGQKLLGSDVAANPMSFPADVKLDPKKRYYISVLPGDAAQPFINGYAGVPDCSPAGVAAGSCGHGMGGAPIAAVCAINATTCTGSFAPVTVLTEPSPYPPATLSVFVFEDDYPLNGEHDAGGQLVDTSALGNEPGLGGFQITLDDSAGGTGDPTGNPTYDMFNMPLSNALAGTIDPVTGFDACPIFTQASNQVKDTNGNLIGNTASNQAGIGGMIVTCPQYEADGKTFSPLAGQAVVKNLYQGRYGVIANPGADRIARGEEWVQTNTLDGQKAHDSFMRIGEPGYFQEFGPAGYHVTIGFANPKIINDRGVALCKNNPNADCTHEVKGKVTTARMSRTPDERLYGSGSRDAYGFTQCYVSIGDPEGEEFGFTKCGDDGSFDFTGIPAGNWKITTFDQWNDQVVDGITTAVGMCDPSWNSFNPNPPAAGTCKALVDMGEVAAHQWQANIYTRTYIDVNGDGIPNRDASGNDLEPGLALAPTNIRFRDGSYSNFNNTDLNGYAGFNEVFPLFNWYVIETDSTRYKNTGTHVIYDAGGPTDGSSPTPPGVTDPTKGVACYPSTTLTKQCGNSTTAAFLANTYEPNPLPGPLSLPGSVYCADADCGGQSIKNAPVPSSDSTHSTGRIDAPWVNSYGWQGFSGQSGFLEFGKKPFAPGENGGIHGHVVYASTRPFDDPQLLLQLSWEPLVPHVTVNLYAEGVAADKVTQTLTLVDHTETTSFDDWAQGFRKNVDGSLYIDPTTHTPIPNMNCPGQGTNTSQMPDPYFWFALTGQPQYLDVYANGGTASATLPYSSQFKCYDGMHNWNQLQPAPYDGAYYFPSVTSMDNSTGKPTGTHCHMSTPAEPWGCIPNPDTTDPFRVGTPMLQDGKYVVEVVIPPGYELVKEEDKNILIGDNFIAPAVTQFGGLGNVFILPDQAAVAETFNAYNAQNSTTGLGRTPDLPSHEGDTGSIETYWPCVGELRTVPDFISLFPGSQEVAPFAGAQRHLCDRKEVTLTDQTAALAKFYIFTSTHVASHFTGVITDDFTAEFDPFSPQFGEKFAPAYLPVAVKDWAGHEINRIYADQWGAYNGLNYSSWEVNPPNPTGYGPTTMVICMNDPGPIPASTAGTTTTDPLFQSGYSNFCYELPFMPGQTGYFDTPVVPTSAFAGGYNTPDCSYADATPAISEVDSSDGVGPWVGGTKGTVIAVNLANGGAGYASTPTVSFSGGGGTGAAGTAVISGSITAVRVTNGGRGFTSTPNVGFTIGSGAVATATMTGSVNTVTIADGGSYPRIGTPSVTFSSPGAGCTVATGRANMGNIAGNRRTITSVTITNPGTCYASGATVTFGAATGIGARTATGTVNLAQSVLSVSVSQGGSGYTTATTVVFDAAPAGGANATGTATQSSKVTGVYLTNNGSGYTSAPTVTFTGGTPTTAASATASIETGGTLTITSLGDQLVDNYAYSGPSATAAPYNQQKINRHYGFGASQGTGSVTIGGVTAPVVTWSDTQIVVNVPSGVPACTMQQQTLYLGSSTAKCGELVITAGNGKQSIDTVTVTIGGKVPTHIAATDSIQSKIDAAKPGDLLIVDPTCTQTTTASGATASVPCSTAAVPGTTTISKSNASHAEMVLMWKPVRLQGVGAASSVIDANPHPAGKLDPWRRQVVCLFGLALNGTPITGANPYDPNSTFTCTPDQQFSVDRLPLEATVGWDATLNGNLAEQLIEPTIMGAYEGAGITVLAKGVKFPAGSNPFASDVYPDGTLLLTSSDCLSGGTNPYPSNFLCNPSSIDGLTVKNSSQGGGGIWVHAWGHNLQIANNRVLNNQGTLSGGITVGQGEHPDVYQVGSVANTIPGSCITSGGQTNMALPYCFDMNVNVHNNYVVQNSSLGDELFSSTPAGAGGVTFCSGTDYYKFNFNFVCGNMSTGDGGGVAHVGYVYNGDIEHNTILFNESTNPTIATNGGGLLIMGAPDQDPVCPVPQDTDCVVNPATITPSDGVGPGLLINANLILGNSADSGSGGGLRMQAINGTDVLNFPNGNPGRSAGWPSVNGHTQPSFQTNSPWNAVRVTNNIIANNVAGWDGGGISMQDALNTDVVNNTIVSNVSTASSGVLFQSLFAALSSSSGPSSTNCYAGSNSCPQVAGLVSVTNSAVLTANMGLIPVTNGKQGVFAVTCPAAHGTTGTTTVAASCTKYSVPAIYNDLFWQNRSLIIGVGPLGGGTQNQNTVVSMYNAPFGSGSLAASQNATGACNDGGATYWDLGVRGDTKPGDQTVGVLTPYYSVLTNTGGLSEVNGGTNDQTAPASGSVTNVYCNGARVPYEAVSSGAVPFGQGWEVPPGTNESNALPAPPFTLAPAATVDEGNNWINLRWGPLSLNYLNSLGNPTYAFNPALKAGSASIGAIPSTATTYYNDAPNDDFYGTLRKTNSRVDIGAIEYVLAANTPLASVSPTSVTFPNTAVANTNSQTLTLSSTGTAPLSNIVVGVTGPGFARNGGTCGTTLGTVANPAATCTIIVTFTPAAVNPSYTGSVTITSNAVVTGSPVSLSGAGVAAIKSATLTPPSHAFGTQTRNCPGTGLGALACAADPTFTYTLTNTGNVNMTGIGKGVLGGTNAADFGVVGDLGLFGGSKCGNSVTTLAPGATCTIVVQFKPLTTEAAATKNATISVTDAVVGTETSTVSGTAR